MSEQAVGRLLVLAPAGLLAFFLGVGLIVLIRPWLLRYAIARPNARSSHYTPVAQGGGIAVVLATLAVAWAAIVLWPDSADRQAEHFLIISAAAILLTILGAIDDMHSLPATVRLIAQCIAVGAVVIALPHDMQVLPQLPWWMDRACLLIAGVWFVNLTNFMDGIDWMTVAEAVPVTGAMILLGILGTVDFTAAVIAATLFGAMLGFAPFNKPVARLFLGDAGSLPIGLLLGWLLMQLAVVGHRAAAVILPLYYLADATITLLRRLLRREPFWQSHRTHFYQRATDNGLSVPEIVARVFLTNVALTTLALISVLAGRVLVSVLTLCAAAVLVTALLASFARIKRKQ
ncbi:MAG TPA: glycosyl transferase [Xanthobacteraceae bacterium]|jgi:UDP-N-acetylmuramyl pentapeptide phosphotransferase/UDP-N-acetylglucosamine-1-phosphate transferase